MGRIIGLVFPEEVKVDAAPEAAPAETPEALEAPVTEDAAELAPATEEKPKKSAKVKVG